MMMMMKMKEKKKGDVMMQRSHTLAKSVLDPGTHTATCEHAKGSNYLQAQKLKNYGATHRRRVKMKCDVICQCLVIIFIVEESSSSSFTPTYTSFWVGAQLCNHHLAN